MRRAYPARFCGIRPHAIADQAQPQAPARLRRQLQPPPFAQIQWGLTFQHHRFQRLVLQRLFGNGQTVFLIGGAGQQDLVGRQKGRNALGKQIRGQACLADPQQGQARALGAYQAKAISRWAHDFMHAGQA